MIPAVSPVLTKADLIARARAEGFDPSTSLVDDWVERGLLDSPRRRGRGRGKGVAALWPEEQAQLFTLLLSKRKETGSKSLEPLYNIPVSLWLLWGDQFASTSQVRRALREWLSTKGQIALRRAKELARQTIRQLDHPEADQTVREYAFEELIAAMRGKADLVHLRDALGWLFDPNEEGRAIGPPEATMTSDGYVSLIEARLIAWRDLESVSDEQLGISRLGYRTSITDYQRAQPTLAKDQELGHLFEELTLEAMVNRVCLDFLTHIGLGLMAPQEVETFVPRK
jgi:hypothetical protein